MMDPFAALDADCGQLSVSQDSDLLNFPFLVDGETPSPSSSSDDSASLPPADAPILFYSPPNSPTAADAADAKAPATTSTSDPDVATNADAPDTAIAVDDTDALTTTTGVADVLTTTTGVADAANTTAVVADAATATAVVADAATATAVIVDAATTVDVADVVAAADPTVPDLGLPPFTSPTSPKETLTDHPPNRFRKRSRGPKLRSPDPEEEVDDKYRYQSLEVLKDLLERRSGSRAADARRKLPASFVDRVLEDARGKHRRRVNFPRDLPDLVRYFSSKCDKRFANTDILDIAKMKGMEFPPVKWWRPGGYEAKDKEPADEDLEPDD